MLLAKIYYVIYFISISLRFQVSPQEKFSGSQIWRSRRPCNVTRSRDQAAGKCLSQHFHSISLAVYSQKNNICQRYFPPRETPPYSEFYYFVHQKILQFLPTLRIVFQLLIGKYIYFLYSNLKLHTSFFSLPNLILALTGTFSRR